MISSSEDRCGVAAYTKALCEPLGELVSIKMVPSPHVTDRKGLEALAEQLNEDDIAHVQYHPDLFGWWRYPRRIRNFVFFIDRLTVPRVITVHDLTHRLPFRKVTSLDVKKLFYNAVVVPVVNSPGIGAFLRGKFLDVADHLIVHTSETKRFLESLGMDGDKISVLYPGVPEIRPSGHSMREELGLGTRRSMTILGFIIQSKGYETVLSAMKHLPDDLVLVIAGGVRSDYFAPYFKQLQSLIGSLGLQDRVIVTGYLDDERIADLLTQSDILLAPYRGTLMTPASASYAFSYALAAKRPIIASDMPYFCEIERQCSVVKTFPEGDSDALAKVIKEVLDDEAGSRKADDYCERWSWKNVAAKTVHLYQDSVQKSGR
jgi:glycosyltransferase involved in cell wall biosynthesis